MSTFTFYSSATDLIEQRAIIRSCQDTPAQVKAASKKAARRTTPFTKKVFLSQSGKYVELPSGKVTRRVFIAAYLNTIGEAA